MLQISVTERSEVAEARRRCVAIAEANGFDDTDAGRVAIVATELASNLVKHAGGGSLLCGFYEDQTGSGIEILSLDRGPGMANPSECLRDGYSTGGTSGHGLGAVRRQASVFDIVSKPGAGTVLHMRMTPGRPPLVPTNVPHPAWGAVSIPKPGEDVCGDAWAAAFVTDALAVIVADGLGHGPDAALAANEAVRTFRRQSERPAELVASAVHESLRATRGAAIGIAHLYDGGDLRFAGIGNIAGLIGNGTTSRRVVSMNGTAGHNARRVQAFDYPLGGGPVVLFSDGISGNWSWETYAEHAGRHPTLLAALIYRDNVRGRDDATVLVAYPKRRP